MKDIVKKSYTLLIENAKEIALLCFPFLVLHIANELVGSMAKTTLIRYATYTIDLIIKAVFIPSLLIFFATIIRKKQQGIKNTVYNGMVYAPYILVTYIIITSPAIIFALSNQYMNLAFSLTFFIVYMFFIIKTSFTSQLIVFEEFKPFDAIKNSFKFTENYSTTIIFSVIIASLPFVILTTLISRSESLAFIYYILSFVTHLVVETTLFVVYYKSYQARNPIKA